MISSLVKMATFLAEPRGFDALRWSPRSLASLRICNGLMKIVPELQTVIDGGGNIGQFARAITQSYPKAKVYSFEPSPKIAEKFEKNLSDRPNVKLTQSALGDEVGAIVFYPNEFDQSSSILQQSNEHHGSTYFGKELPPIQVPITTLDKWAESVNLQRPMLLKLDLQGYELKALMGARELLRNTDYVLLEGVFDRMYQNEPVFVAVQDFLRSCGLVFRRPLAFVRDNSGLIVQMDALFERDK